MKKTEEFKIPIAGLKEKVYHFEYELDESLFESAGESLVEEPHLLLHLKFDKTHEPYVLDFEITGDFRAECDRCASEIRVPVYGDYRLFVEFGEPANEEEDDTEVMYIGRDDHEIKLYDHVHDFAILSLPVVRRCSEPEDKERCDRLVESFISGPSDDGSEETDPRWAALQKLKQKGNGTS